MLKTVKENKYKISCRTKGTISNYNLTITAPNKDSAFFRAIENLESRGVRNQTVIENVTKQSEPKYKKIM